MFYVFNMYFHLRIFCLLYIFLLVLQLIKHVSLMWKASEKKIFCLENTDILNKRYSLVVTVNYFENSYYFILETLQ